MRHVNDPGPLLHWREKFPPSPSPPPSSFQRRAVLLAGWGFGLEHMEDAGCRCSVEVLVVSPSTSSAVRRLPIPALQILPAVVDASQVLASTRAGRRRVSQVLAKANPGAFPAPP